MCWNKDVRQERIAFSWKEWSWSDFPFLLTCISWIAESRHSRLEGVVRTGPFHAASWASPPVPEQVQKSTCPSSKMFLRVTKGYHFVKIPYDHRRPLWLQLWIPVNSLPCNIIQACLWIYPRTAPPGAPKAFDFVSCIMFLTYGIKYLPTQTSLPLYCKPSCRVSFCISSKGIFYMVLSLH